MATNGDPLAIPPSIRVKMERYEPGDEHRESLNNLNGWFSRYFTDAARLFGPGFLIATCGQLHMPPKTIPLELNDDAWAYALRGDPRLTHRTVYFVPEDTFYFFDATVDAWCPTTEAKLQALLSNYLIRLSQEVGPLVDVRPIFSEFRKPEVLRKVIERAKALLAADRSFFQGEQGHRRLIDGKIIEPTAKSSYELFVEQAITREDRAPLTVTEAFHGYYSFCRERQMAPLARQEFKSLVAEVIREEYHLGLRKDVRGRSGGVTQGWYGLRIQDTATLGMN